MTISCGGCGATKSSERCLGCFHDFGDEASAWVRPKAQVEGEPVIIGVFDDISDRLEVEYFETLMGPQDDE